VVWSENLVDQATLDLEENPYAADESNANAIDTRLPASTYLYATVVFIIGGVAAGFVAFAAVVPISLLWEPAAFAALFLCPFAAVAGGLYASSRMVRRLAALHRQKVEWQIAEVERLGEFYPW
jgi:hypothetical protein